MKKSLIDARFQEAVQHFWNSRVSALADQKARGVTDAGGRGSVTANVQMRLLEKLVADTLSDLGLDATCIKTKSSIELPGYYRPEKQWDLLVVADGKLLCALEFKSQVGPSFGNNFNNRVEEAIGSASDVWIAYREGRFGKTHRPFLGYFFLLEDCPKVHNPVRVAQSHFPVDPIFEGSSYAKRYQILCERLLLERLYDTACFTIATNSDPTLIKHPSKELSFNKFISQLRGSVTSFLEGELFG